MECVRASDLRVSVSTRSAPEGIRTPNLLIRNKRGRIPLRISRFHPVLSEHGVGDRCCCSVSVNAGQACTVCAHGCAHTQRLDSLAGESFRSRRRWTWDALAGVLAVRRDSRAGRDRHRCDQTQLGRVPRHRSRCVAEASGHHHDRALRYRDEHRRRVDRAAHEHAYHLVLVEDAMAGLTASDHAVAVERIFPCIG